MWQDPQGLDERSEQHPTVYGNAQGKSIQA